jgi:hypothetical protein
MYEEQSNENGSEGKTYCHMFQIQESYFHGNAGIDRCIGSNNKRYCKPNSGPLRRNCRINKRISPEMEGSLRNSGLLNMVFSKRFDKPLHNEVRYSPGRLEIEDWSLEIGDGRSSHG